MSSKRVTLADIARELGVSVNTVSHALNNKKDISEALKQKIREKADELGYIPNSVAGSMRSGRSKCLSVIVGDIANPHFSILIKEIETAAYAKGYTVFVLNTSEDEKLERQAIVTSLSKGVDGIILCPVQKTDENIRFLQDSKLPFTLIGRYFEDIDTNFVVCDDKNGGYLAASYLLDNGHENIAIFMAPEYISSSRERMEGIRTAFEERGKTVSAKDVLIVSPSTADGDALSFPESNKYTAAICFSDLLALSVLSEAERELEIVSFDNIRSKFIMPLSFKSITSSKTKMSQKAVEILMNCIENPLAKNQHVVLPTEIVIS